MTDLPNKRSSSWLRFRSELFAIRLWQEESVENEGAWRGCLHHIASGQMHDFHDWDTLIDGLMRLAGQDQGAVK